MSTTPPAAAEQPRESLTPDLQGVVDLCGRLLSAKRPEEQLDLLVEGAIEILQVERGFLVRRDEDRLVFHRRWGSRPVGASEPVSRAIVADALESAEPILVENASLDARYSMRESVRANDLRSVLAARIQAEEPAALYLESGSVQLGDRHLELFGRIVGFADQVLRRSVEALLSERSQELFERFDFQGIVARDPKMRETLELVAKVATADYPVLIQGPSGSGKELVAQAIHRNSRRRAAPLRVVNCGAISSSLLESQMFGHRRGAFTGATEAAPGIVRDTEGGTLLLDEIGDMPLELQVKLLRTLQSGEIQPVGASAPVRVDVRFLASTHRDLAEEVGAGRFRADLHQRLRTLVVSVPPLAERPGDVLPLFRHFLDRAARDQGCAAPEVLEDAGKALLARSWTGNVRELENEAKRLVVLHGDEPVTLERLCEGDASPQDEQPLSLEDAERRLIRRHLAATGGNRSAAARALGISREGLRKKMKRLGVEAD